MLERIFSPEYFDTSLPSPRVPVMVNWRNIAITPIEGRPGFLV
jgi:hypothetical protein